MGDFATHGVCRSTVQDDWVFVFVLPTNKNPGEIQDKLGKTADQFLIPKTLQCNVSVSREGKTRTTDGTPMPGTVNGTYQFWVDGKHYRLLQEFDRGKFPNANYDIRWNGELWQCLLMNSSDLLVSHNQVRPTPQIGLLPLLRPFQFLLPLVGPESVTYMRFDELGTSQFRQRFSQGRSANADDTEAVFPGGHDRDGTEYTYRVEFHDRVSFLPSKIRAVTSGNIDRLVTEIAYREIACTAGTALLPNQVKVTYRDSDNSILYTVVSTVTNMISDQVIAPEVFTVDFQTCRNISDDDITPDEIERRNKLAIARIVPPRQAIVRTEPDQPQARLKWFAVGVGLVLTIAGIIGARLKRRPSP
jgi:hypothetical protein